MLSDTNIIWPDNNKNMHFCIVGGIFFGSIEDSYLSDSYRTRVNKAFDDIIEEGLGAYEYKGDIKVGEYCEVSWVIRVK